MPPERDPCPPRRLLAGLLPLVAVLGFAGSASGQVVERVVDGDTIVVRGVGSVRLIGVDTPETVDPRRPVQFFGREASAFTRRMVEGRRVRLEYDQERTDRYGRTLAYVWLEDGTHVNAEIIRQGYGFAYTSFPFRYMEDFRRYQREARLAEVGLWGAEGDGSGADGRSASAEVSRWDDNRNGIVSCAEATAHGIAPVRRGHPAYPFMNDRDGDGVVCESAGRGARTGSGARSTSSSRRAGGASRWDDNGNGRVSCAEARRHGIAPVRRGHPAYPFMNDRDGDGVVCEGD